MFNIKHIRGFVNHASSGSMKGRQLKLSMATKAQRQHKSRMTVINPGPFYQCASFGALARTAHAQMH